MAMDRLETLLDSIGLLFRPPTAKITVSPTVTTTSVLILPANTVRRGLIIYNNSSNSGYLAFGGPANSSTSMSIIIATFANYTMSFPVYTGAVYAIRNAGTGTFLCTEFF